ncbi:MAG: hypothetical protein ABSA76_00995 [Bacteroidales bacterium]
MKKLVLLLFLLLTGCASMQPRQEPTLLMNSDAKIQYYQEQITHYQYLIDQERKKQAEKK